MARQPPQLHGRPGGAVVTRGSGRAVGVEHGRDLRRDLEAARVERAGGHARTRVDLEAEQEAAQLAVVLLIRVRVGVGVGVGVRVGVRVKGWCWV